MPAKTFLKSTLTIFAISILPAHLTFAAPPRYEIIDLGTLGGDYSYAQSINNNGQIVGYARDSLEIRRATLFDPTGAGNNIDLGSLGGEGADAYSINDNGQIVGIAGIISGNGHAALYDPTGNGNNIDLGTLDSDACWAESISNVGQIVGETESDPEEIHRAVLIDSTGHGNNIDLNTLIDPATNWTLEAAFCINDNGWIIGYGVNPVGETHAYLLIPKPPKIIYVDDDAAGASDGSSWADAFNYLQDAIAAAYSGDEIRVAQGIYKPDQGAGITPGDREATFQLINGITLKGGFAGFGQPDPNTRDIELYETILSGDLNGDDVDVNDPCDLLTEPTRAENSYHVVTASGTYAAAMLDGFTVIGGHANGSYSNNTDKGGGVYGGSPVLLNCTLTSNYASWGGGMVCLGILADCTFIANSANFGGGMYGWGSLTNCTFIGNSAREEGGGIHGSGWLTGCTFRRNSAGYRGGAMYICDEDVTFIDCLLEENSAGKSGGGVFVYQGKAELIDCILHGNSASQGGALASEGSFFILIDCSLTGNSASQSGGGVWNWGYRLIMMSCSITDNRAEQGGGISNTYGEAILTSCTLTGNCAFQSGGGLWNECGDLCLTNCTFAGNSADRGHAMIFNPWEQWCSTSIQLTNCILWDGGNEVWNNHYSAEITIAHSDVQGGPTAVYDPCNVIIWGNGNIDIDPCFVEPGYWDVNGIWVDGDYHLLASSPCIDAGDPNYIAEPNETDLDGRPRVINGRIDMGAYEYSPPIQADIRIIPRTINLRNKGQWIAAFLRLPEDYNVTDIDPNSIFLKNEIEPQWFWCDEEEQVVMVRFSREDVQAILDTGDIDLTITGRLTDGAAFKATDTIKVIGKAGKN